MPGDADGSPGHTPGTHLSARAMHKWMLALNGFAGSSRSLPLLFLFLGLLCVHMGLVSERKRANFPADY